MTGPTQRWFVTSLCLLLAAACDDNASDAPESEEHGDHAHEEADEHAHGGASSSDSKASNTAGKAGSSERSDSSETEKANAGAGGKSASKGSAGAGGKPVKADKSQTAEAGSGGNSAGTGGKSTPAAGQGGVGGGAEPMSAAGSGGMGPADSGDDLDLTIRFKAKVADATFACGEKYAMQGSPGTEVTPQDLRLFIQDLALIKEDGTRVPVKLATRELWQSETVALLDFEDATGNCAGTAETNQEITGTIPSGSYKGLSFVNGVPEALNHSDATKQSDPLKSSAALSWSWLSGFRFAKVELVKTDAESFGEGVFHPGSQACSGNPSAGEVMCSKPNRNEVVIDTFDPAKDTVVIDLAALFAKTDMNMDSACHSGEKAVCESMFDAWGINFADGKPKAGQTVFKKE